MSRHDLPDDWFYELADGRGDGQEGESDEGRRTGDAKRDALGDVDRAMDSLRAPLPKMPDLTASILNAVDERREFLCPKTRWWVKAVRVAACAAVAGGALTAVLAWRFAPQTTTLVETPPTPMTLLLSATEAKASEGPAVLRSGLTNVAAAEPAGLLRIVIGPIQMSETEDQDAGRAALRLASAEPLPCACRKVRVRLQRGTFFGTMWLETVSDEMVIDGAAAEDASASSEPHAAFEADGRLSPMASINCVAIPGAGLASAARVEGMEGSVLVWSLSSQDGRGVAVNDWTLQRRGRAGRRVAQAKDATPLADGVGSLLGGSGGSGAGGGTVGLWVTPSSDERAEKATDAAARR